jgi:hypothetical protein
MRVPKKEVIEEKVEKIYSLLKRVGKICTNKVREL